MAVRPLHPCLNPGCSELTSGARCQKHQEVRDAEWQSQRQAWAANRAEWTKLYRTPEWKRLRAAVLSEEPYCRCGCGQRSQVVDHIVPHRGDLNLFFDRSNLQAMTAACHSKKTSREDSWGKSNRSDQP